MTNNIPEKFDKSDPLNIKIVSILADKYPPLEIPFKNRILSSKTVTKLAVFLKLQEKIEKFFQMKDVIVLQNELFSYLKTLKKEFDLLSKTNVSQDITFCEELSKNWHLILDFIIAYKDLFKSESLFSELKKLIEEIHKYPENSDHPLGYYLTKFVGGKWLPFPFMEILEKLHEEYLLKGDKSTLAKWTRNIEDIVYTPT